MRCILLTAPGEDIEERTELEELGYSAASYPVSREAGKDECADCPGIHTGSHDKPRICARGLSFASMILDPQFREDDLIIFGESGAIPVIRSEKLRPVLEELVRSHPEADAFRLSHPAQASDSACGWNAHVLVIPVAKREKAARIFSSGHLPTDTVPGTADSNGTLCIMETKHNYFYQTPRIPSAGKPAMNVCRNRKMALCLSSYKRFEDLQRQIYCMMHQSYHHFHLFVAVKGISSFLFQSVLIPQFQEFMDEGRLTMRWFPNKNQLSNLADTIRGLDTTDYELFLKIDDDDFYGPDYLRTINEFHSEIPQHHCSCFNDWNWVHYKYRGISSLQKEFYHVFGATMVLTRSVMKRLMTCEEHPEMINPVIQRWYKVPGHGNIGFSEDNFIHKLMLENGWSNIAPFIAKKKIIHHVIVQKANASVTRGAMLEEEFQEANTAVAHDARSFEYVLSLRHPLWSDAFRIFGTRGNKVSDGDPAEVLSFSPEKIAVKWDYWGEEAFVRQDDGSYEFLQ